MPFDLIVSACNFCANDLWPFDNNENLLYRTVNLFLKSPTSGGTAWMGIMIGSRSTLWR